MCGRFTLRNPRGIKIERLPVGGLFNNAPRYNIAPSQSVLVIVEGDCEREAALFQWGLIPSWSKEPKGFINARAETLDDKPSFSDSFRFRRCLIPADGFFEWERVGRSKRPFYFQLNDESQFAFAGIWDRWRTGELSITSCAIITTAANELVGALHDRMPAILQAESYDVWLDPKTDPDGLKELLSSFPASKMKSHPVSGAVNHPENDSEKLIERVDVELGTTPSLF